MRYYEQAKLKTYADAKAHFSKAKTPSKGRPLNSCGRLFQVGDEYIVRVGDMDVAKFTPDNKLVFIVSPKEARTYGQTLSSSLYRMIPILWVRVGMQRYRLQHTAIIDSKISKSKPQYPWYAVNAELKTAPELFDGLTFDLSTGDAVNARKDLKDSVIPDKRAEWLRKLRKFKRNVKLRAKLGAIDGMIAQMNKENNNSPWHHVRSNRPNWQTDEWLDNIVTAMKDETCPPELMRAFIISSFPMWGNATPNGAEVVNTVEGILTEMSIDLRKKFGVFDQSIGEAA